MRTVATERIHTQGNPQLTGNDKDVMVNGPGFFPVLMPDGTQAYTRDGSFQNDQNGQLVTSSGFVIQPPITVPVNAQSITVGRDGTVSVTVAGDNRHHPDRRAAAGHVHQPGRPRVARREPVHRNHRLR